MNKIILNSENIRDLVSKNRYQTNEKTKFISRCIDGRYENEKDLPALAFPGADIGELALIFAAANAYGFEVDRPKALKSLIRVIGGVGGFRVHTDSHADPKVIAGGCGHWKQINLDPKAFNLEQEDVDFIKKNLSIAEKPVVLQGEHMEGAVLILKGGYGVYPRFDLETDHGKNQVEVFIYHQSLVDQRNKALAKELVKSKAVRFLNGEDEEWLYNAFCDMSENHLMEIAGRLAKGLPIYFISFNEDGDFKIEVQETV